jgi:hypothetical protein
MSDKEYNANYAQVHMSDEARAELARDLAKAKAETRLRIECQRFEELRRDFAVAITQGNCAASNCTKIVPLGVADEAHEIAVACLARWAKLDKQGGGDE